MRFAALLLRAIIATLDNRVLLSSKLNNVSDDMVHEFRQMAHAKTILTVSLRLRHSKPPPFSFRLVAASCRFAAVTFAIDHIAPFRPSKCLVCTTARVVSVDTFTLLP